MPAAMVAEARLISRAGTMPFWQYQDGKRGLRSMYQRILAALDGSPAAAHAAAEAIRIAAERHATLGLLHVVEMPLVADGVSIDFTAVDEQAEQGRALLAEAEAQARQAGIEPDVMLRSSDGRRTGEVVVAEATRWAAELIVLGSHGHGFMEKLLGSTTEEVLRSAPVPLLLVSRATPPSR